MFWHSLLTISLLSSQGIWSLPFPGHWQPSQGQPLETMNLRDIVRIVGPRHEAVIPVNQQKSGYHNPNSTFLANFGMLTEYHGQANHLPQLELDGQANHLPQLELDENAEAYHNFGSGPVIHSPSGNVNGDLYGDTHLLEDMKKNRRSDAITEVGLGVQSGSPEKSPLVEVSFNAGGIWSLLPLAVLDVPGMEFTPEQMEEITQTGRLCTEDGECVYFSGGWGEACCPFG